MPEKIAVAILNWNGASLLKQFLPSVVEHSRDIAQVYVIDNASSDDSLAVLSEGFPTVKVIVNDANYGYAGGYNKGIKYIPEEFIVLLNSDVEVTQNWLPPLLRHFEDNPRLAAIQPKILDLKSREYFEYAGACGGFIDELGYPFCRGRIFDEIEKDQGQYDSYHQVFWATGASLMIRKSAFGEVGGLNERLFAHMEEIDLCWRLHNHNYEVACEPASGIYHLGGATLNQQSPRKTFLNFRNNLIILFLNLPDGEAFVKILYRLILDGAAGLKFLLDKEPKHLLAVLKAHFSFYGMFFSLAREKKRHIQKPLKKLNGVYHKSLVEDFFLRKKKKFSDLDLHKIKGYQL